MEHLKNTAKLLRAGKWQEVWHTNRAFIHANHRTVGLRRDLTIPFPAPDAAIPITVRLLRDSDIEPLFKTNLDAYSGGDLNELMLRYHLVKENLATCYIAENADHQPCYMQWLVGSNDNDRIQRLFGGRFPLLAKDEALLEGAFTLAEWRGKKIMPAAMAQIAEKATNLGVRWVITFVADGNIPSLKGCARAGFEPYLQRIDKWRFFRRRSEFSPFTESTQLTGTAATS